MRDAEVYNIDERFNNGMLEVTVSDIQIELHLQQILRILSYLLDQLLPSIATKDAVGSS